MSSAKDFYKNLGDDLKRAIKSVTPFRATANGDAAGKASIIRLGQAIADGESYGRLDGFDIANGDELVCFTIGGKPVVAKLLTAAPSSHKLSGNLVLTGALTAGNVTAANVVGSSFNSPIIHTEAASTATNTSTTSTTNYSAALLDPITLPAGVWTVYCIGGVELIHSAGSTANMLIDIDGNNGTARALSMNASIYTHAVSEHIVAGKSGGPFNCGVWFKSSTAGTTSARNPWLLTIATRTS